MVKDSGMPHRYKVPGTSRSAGNRTAFDLEEIVLSCLAKKPAYRPRSARALNVMLGRCRDAREWDADRSRGWWNQFGEAAGQ